MNRRGRALRMLLPLAAVALLLSGCTFGPSPFLTSSTVKYSNALGLVNLWKVDTGKGVDGSNWLRLDGQDLMAWNKCGHGQGGWDAEGGQLFATFAGAENNNCTRGKTIVLPWLKEATGYRIYNAHHAALLNAAGGVIADLTESKEMPPKSAYYSDLYRYAPDRDEAKSDFVIPTALPESVKAADDITGRWVPLGSDPRKNSSLEFLPDGRWRSAGCSNSAIGGWQLNADGRLFMVPGIDFQVACAQVGAGQPKLASIPYIQNATRVGMVGDQLTFYDVHGKKLGAVVRG